MVEGWSNPEASQRLPIDPGGAMNTGLHDLSFLGGMTFQRKRNKRWYKETKVEI